MIIDIHGHIGTWPLFYIPEPTAAWLVTMNRRLGISACGVSHLSAISADTELGNQKALQAARAWPGEIGVWLVVNPHQPAPLEQLEAQLKEPGVWGFKFHSDVHETPLSAPDYEPYIELAQAEGVPVLAHGQADTPWSNVDEFELVATRHPSLKLIMGHSALWPKSFPRAARVAREYERVYLDTSGSRMTGTHLVGLVRSAGVEKVVFGSDASFLDQRYALGMAMQAPLTEEERTAVLGKNARTLLGSRLKEQ